jgi:hypothetical protein
MVSVCPTYRRSAAAASGNENAAGGDERARGTSPRARGMRSRSRRGAAVRALMGVVAYSDATRGVVTTTSGFAPKIRLDPCIGEALKHDLELVDGVALQERLARLKKLA